MNTPPNPRIRRTPAHVIFFSRRSRLESSSQQESLCLIKTIILHIWHSMSHAPSLLFPSHLSSTSLSTCTPVRPSIRLSTRPSTRLSLMFTSHGDLPCADASHVSCGRLAKTHPPELQEARSHHSRWESSV